MERHPRSKDLVSALEQCNLQKLGQPLVAEAYRWVTPGFANDRDFLSGEGGMRHANRWNVPGMRAVYLSLEPETPVAELREHCRRFGLPFRESMPRVFAAVDLRLETVLDLTRAEVLDVLQVSVDELRSEQWWEANQGNREALTQAIGRCVWESEVFEAIMVPVAPLAENRNLVWFPERKSPGSTLQIWKF